MRRVITGHNEEGKSIVTIDGPPSCSIGEEVGGLFELWNTDGSSINTKDTSDRADTDIILSPPKNGTKFRYFQINPTPQGVCFCNLRPPNPSERWCLWQSGTPSTFACKCVFVFDIAA